jgi:hypothetical protein
LVFHQRFQNFGLDRIEIRAVLQAQMHVLLMSVLQYPRKLRIEQRLPPVGQFNVFDPRIIVDEFSEVVELQKARLEVLRDLAVVVGHPGHFNWQTVEASSRIWSGVIVLPTARRRHSLRASGSSSTPRGTSTRTTAL